MKFNEDGFVHRMAEMWQSQSSQSNVCTVVRHAVAGTILFSLITSLVILFVIFNIASAFVLFTSAPYVVGDELFGSMMIICNIILVLMVVTLGRDKLSEEYDAYRYRKWVKAGQPTYVAKQPSLFVQWIKDKHNKICTTVEFVKNERD